MSSRNPIRNAMIQNAAMRHNPVRVVSGSGAVVGGEDQGQLTPVEGGHRRDRYGRIIYVGWPSYGYSPNWFGGWPYSYPYGYGYAYPGWSAPFSPQPYQRGYGYSPYQQYPYSPYPRPYYGAGFIANPEENPCVENPFENGRTIQAA